MLVEGVCLEFGVSPHSNWFYSNICILFFWGKTAGWGHLLRLHLELQRVGDPGFQRVFLREQRLLLSFTRQKEAGPR